MLDRFMTQSNAQKQTCRNIAERCETVTYYVYVGLFRTVEDETYGFRHEANLVGKCVCK